MEYNIQNVILRLQRYAAAHTDITLLSEDELLKVIAPKVNNKADVIRVLKDILPEVITERGERRVTMTEVERLTSLTKAYPISRQTLTRWCNDGIIHRYRLKHSFYISELITTLEKLP